MVYDQNLNHCHSAVVPDIEETGENRIEFFRVRGGIDQHWR